MLIAFWAHTQSCDTKCIALGSIISTFSQADRDGDGEVNEEEFLRIMKKTNLF